MWLSIKCDYSFGQYWTWSLKGTLTCVSHGWESIRGRSKQTMVITVSGDGYIGEKCLVNEKTAIKKSSRIKDPIQWQNLITALDHVVSWVKSCDGIMFSCRQSTSCKFNITQHCLYFQKVSVTGLFLWTVKYYHTWRVEHCPLLESARTVFYLGS